MLSRSCTSSAAGSVLSYPPTQPTTPVPGLSPVPSPVPVLGPQAFLQVDIPRVFLSSDGAAGARLVSLLRKETFHWRGEGQGAFLTQKFTPPNTLVKEIIAWILTVHSFPTSIYCPYAYLKRRSSLRWANAPTV
jgi:hypothetical protein